MLKIKLFIKNTSNIDTPLQITLKSSISDFSPILDTSHNELVIDLKNIFLNLVKFNTEIDVLFIKKMEFRFDIITAFTLAFPDAQLLYKPNIKMLRLMSKEHNINLAIFNMSSFYVNF